MIQLSKQFQLSACALAACLLVSACGGGALSTDTVPPTVAITDNVAGGGTATGPVTFNFTFSEDVGTSFTAEDLVIAGGTAGTLTKTDSTHYSLVVTPTGATGTITVSVAAAKFKDIANNDNVASATLSQAFAVTPVAMDFSDPAIKFNPFEGLISAAIADDPVLGASNKVAKLVKGPTGQPWAGATIYTVGTPDPGGAHAALSVPAFDLSGSKIVTLRSYTGAPVGTKITLKLEDANNAGANIAAEATTTVQNAWETLSFNFANLTTGVYSAATTYNTVSIFPAFSIPAAAPAAPAVNTNFYFDDLSYTPAIAAPVPTAPTTAAATPTALAANVLSIYSDAYTPIAGVNLSPNWGATTAVTEVTVAGNKTEKYATLNYQGIDFVGHAIDVSAMTKLHIDVWTPDLAALKISLISTATGGETPVTLNPTLAGWNSFDIDLAGYTAPDKTKIDQIKFDVQPATGTLYFDNLYFWKPAASGGGGGGGTAPTTAAPTPTEAAAGVLSIYSDAYTPVAGVNLSPNWGATTAVTEVMVAGNNTEKYTTLNYQGIDFVGHAIDVSTKGKLHIDVWTPDLTALKISLISTATGGENPVTLNPTLAGWNSFDIDLAGYTAPDKTKIDQIKFDVQPATGTLYFDNLYFWGTASAGGSGSTPNPTAVQGSAGPVTIPVLAAADSMGFAGVGDALFAGDYIGTLDTNNNHAAWASAVTRGVASNGNIGYFQDAALSASAQKLEENGWVAGLIDNPTGVPSFFRYFILTAPAATFASSYMGLFANAPNNGTVNVGSYGNMKFRLWGPAEMYEKTYHPTLEITLAGAKVGGCNTTGSGGTEIKKTFVANQTIGAASTYKLSLAAGTWTVTGVCGTDTNATAVASVLGALARVVVNVPGSSFNFSIANTGGSPVTYTTGVNLGPIAFTNN